MSSAAVAPAPLHASPRLTDLPDDVLAHIARHVGTRPSDLLPLAEASPLFHAAALSAQGDHLRLTSATAPQKWAAIAHPHVRALTLTTPVPSDPPLFAAYGLLRAPKLHALSTRADNFTLALVAKASGLRALTLHLRRADAFPQLLHAVAKLPQLDTLALVFAPDFTLLRLPPARRCACAPLRARPDNLARAAPHVADFALSCGCAAAADCTVPAFAALQALSLSGPLPDAPPPHLAALAPSLRKLLLAAPGAPHILARALGDPVTHVHATAPTASTGRLSAPQLIALAGACPRLTSLRAGLHVDAARALPRLATLSELHVWQPVSRASTRAGVAGCPVPRGVLAALGGLRELQLHGAAADASELAPLVRAGRLHSLTVALAGQPGPLDLWLRALLAAARRAPALASLSLAPLADDVASAAARDISAFAPRRRADLLAALARLRRRRPAIALPGVDAAVHALVRASEAADAQAAKQPPAHAPAAMAGVPPAAAVAAVAAPLPPPPAAAPAAQPAGDFEMIGVHEDVLDDGEQWADDDVF